MLDSTIYPQMLRISVTCEFELHLLYRDKLHYVLCFHSQRCSSKVIFKLILPDWRVFDVCGQSLSCLNRGFVLPYNRCFLYLHLWIRYLMKKMERLWNMTCELVHISLVWTALLKSTINILYYVLQPPVNPALRAFPCMFITKWAWKLQVCQIPYFAE